MLKRLFRPRVSEPVGDRLYAAAVTQARRPVFYTDLGAPDQIDARFELYTIHVLLLVLRLRDEGEEGAEDAQRLFDTYVSALDNALRELGVGDLSVAKKMRRLGEALYGRMAAYEAALKAEDTQALTEALARNVYGEEAVPSRADRLSAYVLSARSALAAQSYPVVTASPEWPNP